jgi:hypothetical protein
MPIFSPDFYTDIAHDIDPDQDITPEALAKLDDLARDFMRNILRTAGGIARNSPGTEITAENVHFVLQNYFGMSLSGPSGPQVRAASQAPTPEYQEKLAAVRSFAATRRDE